MSPEVMDFVASHADKFKGWTLEVGAFDVNGSIRKLTPKAFRIDLRAGPGVSRVLNAKDLGKHFEPETFDAVVSTETMEHMEHWKDCIAAMWKVLKTGGWLVMTMSTPGKKRHDYPGDYWRATTELIEKIFGCPAKYVNKHSVAWAVQKGDREPDLTVDLQPIPR